MKNITTRFLLLGLSIISSITILNSCVNNDDVSITEPDRYVDKAVKSYSDLFDVFWTTMDQKYNYFYEQKRNDGMDWSDIYKEYSPKFKALKTFGRTTDSNTEINEDYLKAVEYFKEIINPIIDRHFFVRINFPITNEGVSNVVRFSGDMLSEKSNVYPYAKKINYMKDRLAANSISSNLMLGGYLKSNPDIYYFTFSNFFLFSNFELNLDDRYLTPEEGNSLFLTIDRIEQSERLNAIKDLEARKKLRDLTVYVLNEWDEFTKSAEVVKFNNEVAKFNATEIVSNEFLNATEEVLTKYESLTNYSSHSIYGSLSTIENLAYVNWFIREMNDHVNWAYRSDKFTAVASTILSSAPFYRNFLNPLHKGDIKKLVIDLRNNGGGAVLDARFFSDRFITKTETFGFQRTKEGNGRFNYTPWVETKTKPHRFGIPANIPITILTDKGSASMSEITTLMLKSQGNHVISIGDYSTGATAGLGPHDNFNGGIRDFVADYLYFNMPLMAFKDAKGELIEGIGIKPDIYVTPPTNEEIKEMDNPTTFVDRVMVEAIKYLSSK